MVQPLWKTVWRFIKKLKIELPNDPTIPLLDIYPDKTIIQKDTCTLMFIAVLFIITKTLKQTKCPSTDEWINKVWYNIYMRTCARTRVCVCVCGMEWTGMEYYAAI